MIRKKVLPRQYNNGRSNKEQLQSYLPDYLTGQGIDIKNKFSCLNPLHPDQHPSMGYDPKINRVHCFSCGATYDIFDLYAIQHLHKTPANGTTRVIYPFKEVYNQVANYMGVDVQRFKEKPEDAQQSKINAFNQKLVQVARQHIDDPEAVKYLQKRGISQQLAKRFGLGFIAKWVNPTDVIKKGEQLPPTPRLIIPSSPSSYLARDIRTTVPTGDVPKQKQGNLNLFNGQALSDDSKPIFITEGEFDALSIMEVTDQAAAVALGSTQRVDYFLKCLRELIDYKQKHNQDYDPTILISMDNDNAGSLASNELETDLTGIGVNNYVVNIARSSKDPNEELTKNRDKFKQEVTDRIKDPDDYLVNLVKRIQDRKDKPQYIPTGFPSLDKVLDGGLYAQLYVIGAVSSVGKTTFTTQIADRIAARQGRPVFYFSLETSKDELTEKNLSRLSFELADDESGKPQTARSIDNGYWLDHKAECALVTKAIDEYSKYYSNIHIFDGTKNRPTAKDIYNRVKEYRRKHPDLKPVVMVDYLQILKPLDDRDTDKEKVTKSVAMFKRIASEFEVPVIVISSFNRASYQYAAAMESFKESGEIEYYADTLLGLQYKAVHSDQDDAKSAMKQAMKKIPRDIELVVLKNRNGRSNTSVSFEYYPQYNDFIPGKAY